jgi:hypothetical protein
MSILAQRMRPSGLAKQHGHELAPTRGTPRVPAKRRCRRKNATSKKATSKKATFANPARFC